MNTLDLINKVKKFRKYLNHKKIEYIRLVRQAISYRLFLRAKSADTIEDFNPYKCETIVVNVIGKGIGDAIICSGLISILRKGNYKVYPIISKGANVFLFTHLIPNDGIIVTTGNGYGLPKQGRDKLQFDLFISAWEFNGRNYRLLDLMRKLKYRYSIGCPRGLEKQYRNHIEDVQHSGTHLSEYFKSIIDKFFPHLSKYQYAYAIEIPGKALDKVSQFVDKITCHGIHRLLVVSCITRDPNKCFSRDNISRLCHELATSKHQYKVVVLNYEKSPFTINNENIIPNPFASLSDVIALVTKAYCLVTIDTCFVHVGCQFNVNSLCFYNNKVIGDYYQGNVLYGPGPHYTNALMVMPEEQGHDEYGVDLRKINYQFIHDALLEKKLL